ncbi:MAG TPA: right-handed parallel beta-helix repeat-containing protein, partial [Pseudomonadales bacterium]|nr:right-handed parallel beta-helix repeat-containing protein [Pseudomonadales bacterium]
MKIKFNLPAVVFALLLFCILSIQPLTAFAQGSLTPPGAPGATMVTLSQIEPRTPISSLPFTISTPGSYYVTANLSGAFNQNGIIVAADNVTIDLNGFTLVGGGGSSGEAIWSSTVRQNLVIRNGTVRNWPGSGINFYDSGSSLVTVQNIHSISNGFTGFALKNGSRITDCLAVGNGIRGILVDNDCLVEHCKAAGNGSLGIGSGSNCQLRDNLSEGNVYGLYITGTSNLVSGNTVMLNTANNYIIAQGNQLDLLLSQVPETISWPAKVKLTGSMTVASGNAITISANSVTIDLNGFTLSSTQNPAGSSGNGILVNGPMQNIAIANGFVQGGVTNNGSGVYSGSGFGSGITYSGNAPMNVLVSHVTISGCLFNGIFLNFTYSTMVESCSVQTVGSTGIE